MYCFGIETQIDDTERHRGSASLWAIFGILAIVYFTKEGYKLLGPTVHPILYWAILGIITVFTVVMMGSSIHLRSLGWKSKRALRRELVSKTKRLELAIVENTRRIAELEDQLAARQGAITKKGTDGFALIKKVLSELEQRYKKVRTGIADGSTVSLIEAYEILHQDVCLSNDCMHTLIDCDPSRANCI